MSLCVCSNFELLDTSRKGGCGMWLTVPLGDGTFGLPDSWTYELMNSCCIPFKTKRKGTKWNWKRSTNMKEVLWFELSRLRFWQRRITWKVSCLIKSQTRTDCRCWDSILILNLGDLKFHFERSLNDNKLESLLRTSPIPGPPNTRISSLDEPPLSLIGIILYSVSPNFRYLICYLLAQSTRFILSNFTKDINEVVGSTPTWEDHDMTSCHLKIL